MTGETRVSLVVGLLFIILFGLILSEITGSSGRESVFRNVRQVEAASRGGQIGPASAQEPAPSGPSEAIEAPRSAVPVFERAPVLPPSLPRPPSMVVTPARPTESARSAPARVEPAPVAPAQTGEAQSKTHVVRSGETLSRIAAIYYGQANAARGVKLILDVNRDRVESAARLRINAELIIPPMK